MAAGAEGREGLGRQIERRSIDYVLEDERHGKVWHQGPFWFLGNFQFFTITRPGPIPRRYSGRSRRRPAAYR